VKIVAHKTNDELVQVKSIEEIRYYASYGQDKFYSYTYIYSSISSSLTQ